MTKNFFLVFLKSFVFLLPIFLVNAVVIFWGQKDPIMHVIIQRILYVYGGIIFGASLLFIFAVVLAYMRLITRSIGRSAPPVQEEQEAKDESES